MHRKQLFSLVLLTWSRIAVAAIRPTAAFAMNSSGNLKEIYNIPGSGWKGKAWNWGYGQGTGHDCALICRKRWASRADRKKLVDTLLNPKSVEGSVDVDAANALRDPPFEEVKLILGLAWQNGRWNGSDGGVGGYGDVLATMADARKYETDDEEVNSRLLTKDMMNRFHLISSKDSSAMEEMNQIESMCGSDVDMMRRKCSALVLSEMGFVETGL